MAGSIAGPFADSGISMYFPILAPMGANSGMFAYGVAAQPGVVQASLAKDVVPWVAARRPIAAARAARLNENLRGAVERRRPFAQRDDACMDDCL